LQLLSGIPLNEVAEQYPPSGNTIRRWWRRFQDRFTVDKSDLLSAYDLTGLWGELARTQGLDQFWLTCLNKISLAKAMFHLHNIGKVVP
jgi:hypothetical protein